MQKELARLRELRNQGLLTDDEFERAARSLWTSEAFSTETAPEPSVPVDVSELPSDLPTGEDQLPAVEDVETSTGATGTADFVAGAHRPTPGASDGRHWFPGATGRRLVVGLLVVLGLAGGGLAYAKLGADDAAPAAFSADAWGCQPAWEDASEDVNYPGRLWAYRTGGNYYYLTGEDGSVWNVALGLLGSDMPVADQVKQYGPVTQPAASHSDHIAVPEHPAQFGLTVDQDSEMAAALDCAEADHSLAVPAKPHTPEEIDAMMGVPAPDRATEDPGGEAQPAEEASSSLGSSQAADTLIQAWLDGNRQAALDVADEVIVNDLFSEQAPATTLEGGDCSEADESQEPFSGLFSAGVCTYQVDGLTYRVLVEGSPSAGEWVVGIEHDRRSTPAEDPPPSSGQVSVAQADMWYMQTDYARNSIGLLEAWLANDRRQAAKAATASAVETMFSQLPETARNGGWTVTGCQSEADDECYAETDDGGFTVVFGSGDMSSYPKVATVDIGGQADL